MRVCVIGNFVSGYVDEGMANVGSSLCKELSRSHEVLHVSVKQALSPSFWRQIKDFQPEIVHYIPGVSLRNLLLLRVLKWRHRGVRTITSVQQPNLSSFSRNLVPLVKADLVLAQSGQTEKLFNRLGCQTDFLPNGVDTDRFAPVSAERKKLLRARYGLRQDQFILLHVGPVNRIRNVNCLAGLAKQECQVLIVGSVSNRGDRDTSAGLTGSGCILWKSHFQNIEEIYALADCYVFPTTHKLGSIETPLTVLEAMACNLPVLTTRYGALPRLFTEGDGLYFVDKPEEFGGALKSLRSGAAVSTREKVMPYSWVNIDAKLEQIYRRVIQ